MDIGPPLIGGTLPAVVGFLVALVALPAVRAWAAWPGLVDPIERDAWGRPLPRSGGVAIALGWSVACLVGGGDELRPLVLLGLGAFAIGLHNDLVRSSPKLRLGLLAALSVAVAAVGFRVETVQLAGVGSLPLGVLAVPLSAAWILGTTVAFDLIDGLDGLAGSLAVIAGLGLMMIDGGSGAAAAAALVGATAAFLLFNRPPASIYMGDNGSNLLGFVIGVGSLAALDGEGGFGLLPALLLVAVPVLDAATATLRRFRRGDLFGADLEHLHHRLRSSGRSPLEALGRVGTVAAGCATVAVLLTEVDAATVLLPLAAAGLGWLLWEARVRR